MTARAGVFLTICLVIGLWLWLGSALQPAAESPHDQAAAPERVVSLDPGITEVILRLGASSLLVARPNHTDEFAEIAQLPTVGTGITPNYEAIVRAAPDLILTSGARGAVFDDLRAIAPTLSLPWLSVDDVVTGIQSVATALGYSDAGQQLAAKVEQGLQDRVSEDSPRVLLLIGAPNEAQPDLWYIKDNSLHGAALRAAGGRNAIETSSSGAPSISIERLLSLDPDVVIMMIANPQANAQTLVEHRRFWDRLDQLTAVQQDRIHFLVGGEHFYTGPGIVDLVKGLTRSLNNEPGATR